MSRYKILNIEKFWDEDYFGPEQVKEITIKKASFGEISKIQKQTVDAKMIGTIQNISFDVEKGRNMMVLGGIKSAPALKLEDGNILKFIPGDMKYIENLPNALGQYLYDEIDAFNAPDPNA